MPLLFFPSDAAASWLQEVVMHSDVSPNGINNVVLAYL